MENKDLFEYTLNLIKDVEGEEILKRVLHIFAMVLYQNFDEETLYNFSNNVKTLKMQVVDKEIGINESAGVYNTGENTITISKKMPPFGIFHELFHMASRVKKGDEIYSGLEYITLEYVGRMAQSISEGYTDKMTKKYIPNHEPEYCYEMLICNVLDTLIGEKNMEKMYLTANTDKFYNILFHYLGKEDFSKFMFYSDSISTQLMVNSLINNDREKVEVIKKVMSKIYDLLLKLFVNMNKTRDNFDKRYEAFKHYLDNLSMNIDTDRVKIEFSLKDFSIEYKKDKDGENYVNTKNNS